MKVPTNLHETIVAIAELQASASWLQGQSNLLLGFVTANPQNLQNFADFAMIVSANTDPGNATACAVAQRLLAGGLRQHVSSNPPPSSPGGSGGNAGSNIIQFPRNP